MAGRPLDLTQRQIRAICEGARKAGFTPFVEIAGALIRLIPDDRAKTMERREGVAAERDIRL